VQYDYLTEYPARRTSIELDGADRTCAEWLTVTDVVEHRRLLIDRPALRDGSALRLLDAYVRTTGPSTALRQVLRDRRILRHADLSGPNAIEHAYRDTYGPFAAERPPWVRAVERELAQLNHHRIRLRTGAERAAMLSASLQQLDNVGGPPDLRGLLLRELAVAVAEDTRRRRIVAFEDATDLARHAVDLFRAAALPVQEAITSIVLGTLLMDRLAGHLPANHRRSRWWFAAARSRLGVDAPVERAEVLVGDAIALQYGREDERRANREQAIDLYRRAAEVFRSFGASEALTRTEALLATAFWHRDIGDRAGNIETAIRGLRSAERWWTAGSHPVQHARLQHNLGLMHLERKVGERLANIEQALDHGAAALQVFTRNEFPVQHGQGLLNRAAMYRQRVVGSRSENIDRALRCLTAALTVRTAADFPNEYAGTQEAVAQTVLLHPGPRRPNLERAAEALAAARSMLTESAAPRHHWEVTLQLAEVLAELGRWSAAVALYSAAAATEQVLIGLATGVSGIDAVLAASRDAVARAAYARYRCGQPLAAALVVENGRARATTTQVMINSAADAVTDPRLRARLSAARDDLRAAHVEMNTALPERDESARQRADLARMLRFRNARESFESVVAALEGSHRLGSTADAATMRAAAGALGPGGSIVPVLATPWGGCAIVVRDDDGMPETLDLPELTDTSLLQYVEFIALAQRGGVLRAVAAAGPARCPAESCAVVAASTTAAPTLVRAARRALERPLFRTVAETTWDQLDDAARGLLDETLVELVLQDTLAACEGVLGGAVLRPLAALLFRSGRTSAALMPCGVLGGLPLTAFRMPDGRVLSDVVPVTVLVNARSLLGRSGGRPTERVVAVADAGGSLPWSRAEARSIHAAARRNGLPAQLIRPADTTRDRLLEAFRDASVIGVACHGRFDHAEPVLSALHLAAGDQLTMGQLLTADLSGVRLVILSACQTATTDVHGARDEVRSIAGALVHAGVEAVLATLWPVDDAATSLLVGRFVTEWFPRMDTEPPAAALARAQRWLRERRADELPAGFARRAATTAGVRGRARGPGDAAVRVVDVLDDADRPFTSPYHWAGVQLIGWPTIRSTPLPGHPCGSS
jgi:tetratricopeptide (TPR) repeat protein